MTTTVRLIFEADSCGRSSCAVALLVGVSGNSPVAMTDEWWLVVLEVVW